MQKTNNAGKLADLLQSQMQKHYERNSAVPPLELGVMTGDMKLQLDELPEPIATFMVARHLTLGAKDEVLTKTKKDGIHTHNMGGAELDQQQLHVHEVLIPEKMAKLKPGDRVLVAWANNTPVVVEILVDKSEL